MHQIQRPMPQAAEQRIIGVLRQDNKASAWQGRGHYRHTVMAVYHQDLEARRTAQEQIERERLEAHNKSVTDAAKRMKFD